MNAAHLTRRWQKAAGDPAPMIEARVDQIDDPATGLATRDFLRAELAQVRGEFASLRGELTSSIAQLESRLTWRMITMLSAQIALVGIPVTTRFQVLR